MDRFMLCDLCWVYDLQRRKLSVFVKNLEGNRLKNLMTGEVCDIPKYHGDYGMEFRMDYKKILNTKDYIQYDFNKIYGIAGIKAFTTLKNDAKQVEKELKKYYKDDDHCDYSPYDYPEIDIYQYMAEKDIVSATKLAEPILQQTEEVKRREVYCKNSSSLEF